MTERANPVIRATECRNFLLCGAKKRNWKTKARRNTGATGRNQLARPINIPDASIIFILPQCFRAIMTAARMQKIIGISLSYTGTCL